MTPNSKTVAASIAFVIDAMALQQASGKPFHLATRMEEKKKRSASPSAHAHSNVETKRQLLLDARRERITARMERIRASVDRQRKVDSEVQSSKQSSISTGLAAAEKNRDQLLRDQADSAAQRVKHARETAKKQQVRDEQELKRRRLALQERLVTSELRRHMLMRIPRAKLLDETTVTAETLRIRSAALRIQRWWHLAQVQTTFRAIADLRDADVAALDIDHLMGMIQNQDTITRVSKFLLAVKKATRSLAGKRVKNPTKIFLSAFMIVHHTAEMMPDMDEEKEAVKFAAEEALHLLNDLFAQVSLAKVVAFGGAWYDYHVKFEQWKVHDTEKLLQSMFEHFMQLEQLWESVRSQVNAEDEWKPKIEMQQKSIKAKALRIGGKAALARFLEGQRAFRESSESSEAEVMHDSSPAAPRESVVNSPYAVSAEAAAKAAPAPEVPVPQLHEMFSEFGSGLDNERLAHELIMDPDFELKPNKDSLPARIQAMAKKAFFDKIRETMATEKSLTWALPVLGDIRQQLLDMVTEKSKIHTEIAEVLDMALIEQQANNDALDMPKYLRFISEKMLQLCAPVRDASIRSLAESEDIVAVVERILSILEEMKLDLANYRLQSLRPHLMQQAVEYERSKFKAAMDAGAVQMDKTREWLTGAAKNVLEVAQQRNPQNIDIPENRVRYEAVYFDALLSLIFSPEAVSPSSIAETLMMDVDRIFGFQNELQAITVVAALSMLTKNFVPQIRDDVESLQKLKEDLFVLLQAADTTVDNLALHITAHVDGLLAHHGKTATEEQKQMIKTMVDKTLSYKDTVYLLLNRRIRDSVRVQMVTGKFRRESNSGLDVVQEELAAISRKIFIMARHNRDVFAPWYDEIIRSTLDA